MDNLIHTLPPVYMMFIQRLQSGQTEIDKFVREYFCKNTHRLYDDQYLKIGDEYGDFPNVEHNELATHLKLIIQHKLRPEYVMIMFTRIYDILMVQDEKLCIDLFFHFNPFNGAKFSKYIHELDYVARHVLIDYIHWWMQRLFEINKPMFYYYLTEHFEAYRYDRHKNQDIVTTNRYQYRGRFGVEYFLDCWLNSHKIGYKFKWKPEYKDDILAILRIIYPCALPRIFESACFAQEKRLKKECYVEVFTTLITELDYNCSKLDCFDLTKINTTYLNCKELRDQQTTRLKSGAILNNKEFRDFIYSRCYGFRIGDRHHYRFRSKETVNDMRTWLMIAKRFNFDKNVSLNVIIPKIHEVHEEYFYEQLIKQHILYDQIVKECEDKPFDFVRFRLFKYMVDNNVTIKSVVNFLMSAGSTDNDIYVAIKDIALELCEFKEVLSRDSLIKLYGKFILHCEPHISAQQMNSLRDDLLKTGFTEKHLTYYYGQQAERYKDVV